MDAAAPLRPTPLGGRPAAGERPGARAFAIAVVATLAVYLVPGLDVVGRPLLWLATVVHELGHGVTAMLVGGDFVRFEMWSDGSGVAMSAVPDGGVRHALVAAGGLVGPSLAAAVGFALARRPRAARLALAAIALFFLWALAFKARNAFGAGFIAGAMVVCGATALLASGRVAQLVLMFLSVQLAFSLWQHLGYMFSEGGLVGGVAHRSDSAAIADALVGPYWLWGGLCAALSIAVLVAGALTTIRRR